MKGYQPKPNPNSGSSTPPSRNPNGKCSVPHITNKLCLDTNTIGQVIHLLKAGYKVRSINHMEKDTYYIFENNKFYLCKDIGTTLPIKTLVISIPVEHILAQDWVAIV